MPQRPVRPVRPVRFFVPALAAAVAAFAAGAAQAAPLVVPGTSNPWLAGMPDGSEAASGDVAPAQSPVRVGGHAVLPGRVFGFAASGQVVNAPFPSEPCCPLTDADGGYLIAHETGATNGIAGATVPINALVGVFLGDDLPTATAAPSALDFGRIGTSFVQLAPALKQVFFIGDGLTGRGGGEVQRFVVPDGATRLFLGTMDGTEWHNNAGAFTVTVTSAVPEPAAAAMLAAGLAVLAGVRRRRDPRRTPRRAPT